MGDNVAEGVIDADRLVDSEPEPDGVAVGVAVVVSVADCESAVLKQKARMAHASKADTCKGTTRKT